MTTKKTNSKGPGLLDRFKPAPTTPAVQEPTNGASAGDLTTITIRMSKANWKTLKMFAMHKDESMQGVIMHGIDLALAEKGQKPLEV